MVNPFASFALWAGVFGGLALFLFGMDVMTQALKAAAGDYMKDFLGRLTRNRFVGMAIGALVTAIIQSSSLTTVILVGFITAGVMTLSQSVAVIIGANIGTTVTAQILAFDVAQLALPVIALGFAISFASPRKHRRYYGLIILGLGLVFFGMSIMSAALNPLRDYQPFVHFMIALHQPLLAAAVGMVFTAAVQSSSATTGILLVMASQGLIGLEAAIALTLGANVGTCVTAGLACLGKPREATRAAVVHVLFNVAGVALWIGFVPQLAVLAQIISPAYETLGGLDRLAAEAPRQIANIHTFFNLINALIFVGFTPQIARLVEWMVPDKPYSPDTAMQPQYLDRTLLSTPAIALENARLEIVRLSERVNEMVKVIMPVAIRGSRWQLEDVAQMDRVVDALHQAVIAFLGKISLARLSPRQSQELMDLVQVANDLELIGDQIATAMVTSAHKRIDQNVRISDRTAEVLTNFHGLVAAVLDDAFKAFADRDAELAQSVVRRKSRLAELSRNAALHGFGRLNVDLPNRLNTYAREMEVIEILQGISTIVRRIARTQLTARDKGAASEPPTGSWT